ncbi:MAG: acyl--CoA ligase [Deltaproteobacteria bacterium]|nr:acyl--CoA ligase [Deltaproteobacteria bacterium]
MRAEYPPDTKKNIDELLGGASFPDKEFIRFGATFGDVYKMASWLRVALADSRHQGTAVCLAADSKAVMAAALLASLGGGPALLLPYAFSARALDKMHRETGFTTVISDLDREFPKGVEVICPQLTKTAEAPLNIHTSPRSELLKIFTGGSTGSPQIWLKTSGNIFSEGFYLAGRYEIAEHDCILATIPPYHIYGLLFSIVLPLISSASVVDKVPSFPGEITRAARDNKVTILASVPAHYRALRDKKISLRLAVSSAGMLDAKDNETFSRLNKTGIEEIYGSTETGGLATRNRFLGEKYFKPFTTIDWKIKNHRLAVRSPYISPDLPVDTKGFFTANDRVEAEETDKFSLQGRIDAVTKVGGKRVDLEEISTLIKGEPGVDDCVALALPEKGGREHRIGVLVQGNTVEPKMVKKSLANALEPYAMPRRIKVVDRIPINKNGKYDWRTIAQLLEI